MVTCILNFPSPLPPARQSGVGEVSEDYLSLLSHATETRLRDILEKLTQISQHRTEVLKVNLVFNALHGTRCVKPARLKQPRIVLGFVVCTSFYQPGCF